MVSGILGVGIIGCGKISLIRHIPEYAENTGVKIIGFFDYVYERASELAEKYGARAFKSLDELLNCEEIDAVSVCTTNVTHCEVTCQALESGKHVLCEKPMATSREECELMLSTARSAGKRLLIAHNQRLWSIHKKAKELINNGAIGKPLSFHSTFGHSGPDNWSVDKGTGNWFFDKKTSSFGAMADLGIHKTDVIRYLLDDEIDEVSSNCVTVDKRTPSGEPVSVEDNAITTYLMKSGALGCVSASWTYYGEECNDTVIYGTDGIMKILCDEHLIKITSKSHEKSEYRVEPNKTSGVIDNFINAVKSGEPSVLDATAIVPSVTALLVAVESAKSDKRIKIINKKEN